MNLIIDCQVGIWDAHYRLIRHKNGTVSVRVPFTRWAGNSGALDYDTVHVTGAKVKAVLWYFEHDTLIDDDGHILDHLIYVD